MRCLKLRILKCIHRLHLFLFFLCLGLLPNSFAQYTTTTSVENKVKSIKQELGSPVEIRFEDGRIAQVMVRESTEVFKVPIVLSENSCKKEVGHKCQLIVPYARQQFAAIWKVHPTRKGQALEYSFDKNVTYGQQLAITRMQNNLYENILRRIDLSPEEKKKAQLALEQKQMGYIECDKDISIALPKNREITFWDETYENGNSELAMIEGPVYGARVNLIYRRFQDIQLDSEGSKIKFNPYRKSYGPPTDNYPIGLSYITSWFFRSENVNDPSDELCELKWQVNFSVYFAQISSLAIRANSTGFKPDGYKIYNYSNENPHPHSQNLYKNESWEHQGMQ